MVEWVNRLFRNRYLGQCWRTGCEALCSAWERALLWQVLSESFSRRTLDPLCCPPRFLELAVQPCWAFLETPSSEGLF